MKVLLASQSPRRKELLKDIFEDFTVESYPAEENFVGLTPEETVAEIAFRKMEAVPNKERYDIIITCDTLVYMGGRYFGKPNTYTEAIEMLSRLQGRTHTVVSGLTVWYHGETIKRTAASVVTFKTLSVADITSYLSSHACLDKAGAYAIQDNVVVASYNGSYSNIVGLPLEELKQVLQELKLYK